MYATAFNPSSSPVVVSEEGHTVGGGEWGTIETTDAAAKAALEAGRVVEVEERDVSNPAELNDYAHMALVETARRKDRAEALDGRDKAALTKIAQRGGLIADDEDVLRADLERRIVRSDVDIPKAAPKKASQSASEEK